MVFKKIFKLYLNKCHVTSNLVNGQIFFLKLFNSSRKSIEKNKHFIFTF